MSDMLDEICEIGKEEMKVLPVTELRSYNIRWCVACTWLF